MIFATVLGYVANIVSNISAARKDFQGMYQLKVRYMFQIIILISPTITSPSCRKTFMKLPIKYFT